MRYKPNSGSGNNNKKKSTPEIVILPFLEKKSNFPLPTPPSPRVLSAYQCVCTLCRLHIRLPRSVCGEMLAGRRQHLLASCRLNQAAGMSAARGSVSDLYLSLVIFSDAAHAASSLYPNSCELTSYFAASSAEVCPFILH